MRVLSDTCHGKYGIYFLLCSILFFFAPSAWSSISKATSQCSRPSIIEDLDRSPSIADKTVGSELSNIVLFDGLCNFCNKWVDIMLFLDTGKKFKFCPLQSKKGRDLMIKIGRNADELSTVVLIKSVNDHELYIKSDAVLRVVEQLGLFWCMFSNLNLLLPMFLRNGVYDIIAKSRYSILGKRDTCRCSDVNYFDRFL